MLDVQVVRSDDLMNDERTQIRALLVKAFEGDFSDDDWSHTLGGWHVIARDNGIVAHAALVERILEVGGRSFRVGYVEGVATEPSKRRQGLGATVMRRIGQLLEEVEFQLGVLSTSSHAFYERLGWERWQGPTFVRHDDHVVRTADEDDGIMVLRYGAAGNLDLGLPLCCESRAGDDW